MEAVPTVIEMGSEMTHLRHSGTSQTRIMSGETIPTDVPKLGPRRTRHQHHAPLELTPSELSCADTTGMVDGAD